jgi:urease accessory protein UreF
MTRLARERDLRLGDGLIDLYVEWREECSAVQHAYDRWREAERGDRATAFAAYNAALDREERASDVYAAMIRQATPAAPQLA